MRNVCKVVCAVVAVTSMSACISAEGEVFRTIQQPADLPCVQSPFVIRSFAGATVTLGGAVGAGMQALSVAQSNEDTVVDEISLSGPGMLPSVSAATVAAGAFVWGAAAATGAPQYWMTFQNHSIEGRWHIFASTFVTKNGGLAPNVLKVSDNTATENVGPKAAWLGSRLGIAFRADTRLAFSVTDGASVLGASVGPALLPHPTVKRVLTRAAGFVVVYTRNTSSLAYFNEQGSATGGVELGTAAADATMAADRLVAFTATGSALARVGFASDGSPVARPMSLVAAGPLGHIRATSFKQHAAVALIEGTAASSSLRFVWSLDSGDLSYPALPVANVQALDAVAVDTGVLVVYVTPTAIMGRLYCAPGTPF